MSIKSKNEEVPKQSPESQEIDRILDEAYKLMYEMQKAAKVLKEESSEPEERQDKLKQQAAEDRIAKRKGLIQEKIEQLKALGMREGELSKLAAALDDPLLTNF